MKNILGISAGDPAGIGAEVTVKALLRRELYADCTPLVIGDKAALEDALRFTGSVLKLRCVESPEQALGEYGTIDLLDMKILGPPETPPASASAHSWEYGKASVTGGEAAFRYVEKAIRLAMEKRIAGIVTSPINKEGINMAGHHYAGHTEILAALTGTKDYAMLLACGNLRVIHVTTHVSIKQAVSLISAPRVLAVLRLAAEGLRLLGLPEARIAVAGLNPHASEHGLFGDEEEKAIIPAIAQARAEWINVTGPFPPDTVFVKALGGSYDIVVAMYHDQGHIPLKLVGFKLDGTTGLFTQMSGVNCTLGLPIIRTSVDHGTAYDRAGKNISNEQSMIEAIEAALTMVKNRT